MRYGGMQMSPRDPALQFSVMCLDLAEEERKPPTLQYLFYELPFPQLPYRMDRFHVINCWTNGQGQFWQSVKILNPARTKTFIETGEQPFTLEDPYTPQLMINIFADLEFTEQGQYWVQSFLNETLILEYPLTVRLTVGETRRTGIRLPGSDARIKCFSSHFA
jgi:hypothetical protein